MADSFDLLDELGDEKKVSELKARIQKKKASDVISKLDNIENGDRERRSEQQEFGGYRLGYHQREVRDPERRCGEYGEGSTGADAALARHA